MHTLRLFTFLILLCGSAFAQNPTVRYNRTTGSVTEPATFWAESHATSAYAMPALAINTDRTLNTKSISANSTFTFSATPPEDTWFSVLLTADSTARVVTIPSSYSMGAQATITSFTVPPSSKTLLTWQYTGAAYILYGEPATDVWMIAVGDETTALTTGTAKTTFKAPYAATVVAVFAELNTVSSSGTPTFDINEAGASILGNKLVIDASEEDTDTAATAATITDAVIAFHAKLTIDIDTAGTGAKGGKIHIVVIH